LALTVLPLVSGWGGLFTKFNPGLFGPFGVGDDGSGLNTVQDDSGNPQVGFEEALNEDLTEHSSHNLYSGETCSGKTCTANEHCCEGHTCVDTDETTGTCFPMWGKKEGEVCYKDNDCESGFVCVEYSGLKSCQAPIPGEKNFGEDCSTSSDCNIHKGLCCKLHRGAKSKPKKICSYFTDPLNCIGPVAESEVMVNIEHTAGEKRVSGHPDDFLHTRK